MFQFGQAADLAETGHQPVGAVKQDGRVPALDADLQHPGFGGAEPHLLDPADEFREFVVQMAPGARHHVGNLVVGFRRHDHEGHVGIGVERRQGQEEPRAAGADIGDGAGDLGVGFLVAQPAGQALGGRDGFGDAAPRRKV